MNIHNCYIYNGFNKLHSNPFFHIPDEFRKMDLVVTIYQKACLVSISEYDKSLRCAMCVILRRPAFAVVATP